MEKIFHFDSPVEVYTADACVITCYDARFDAAIRQFLKRRGILTFDQIKIAGGPKVLGAPDSESDRTFVLSMIGISQRLHHPPRLLLIAHKDCGAYPGVSRERIAEDVQSAAAFLRAQQLSLSVETYFADFDGIYSIP
ncbi:MAG TPA: carbonic anhydrase [Bryobacteraceae bacterium]|nr:carbonic anhydrase [Bryobacteraceae bacterium]